MAATPPPEGQPAPRRAPFMAALPYLLTVVAAVVCTLLIQAILPPRCLPLPTPTTSPSAAASLPSPIPLPTRAPTPSPPSADARVLRLEVLDLKAEDRRLWSALYLLRTASQLDDAAIALQTNDLDQVNRALLNARRSLDQAYTFSAEPEKGPIDTFRLQVGQIRDDLYLRPEGLDRRLRQIRQLILSLVDTGEE